MKAIAILVQVALAMVPAVAYAQSSEAEAEQLFRDGKKLMKDGKYAEACDAFETSNRLDPVVSTLANLADCREKNGQIMSAWTAFLDVERQTRGDKKQASLNKTAKDRATKLEGRLSYLTVSVPQESNIEGLELTRNGQPFDKGLWNRKLPVDGGEYVIGGRAPGHEEWSTTVTVPGENGVVSVDVPKFKEVEKLVTPPPEEEKTPPEEEELPDVTVEKRQASSFTGRRKVAVAVGAVGLLAAGAGVVFGLQGRDFKDQAFQECPDNPCPNADAANALADKADRRALFANISFGVGAAAVVTAAVLWFTGAPESPRSTTTAVVPKVTPDSVGLDIAVRF